MSIRTTQLLEMVVERMALADMEVILFSIQGMTDDGTSCVFGAGTADQIFSLTSVDEMAKSKTSLYQMLKIPLWIVSFPCNFRLG